MPAHIPRDLDDRVATTNRILREQYPDHQLPQQPPLQLWQQQRSSRNPSSSPTHRPDYRAPYIPLNLPNNGHRPRPRPPPPQASAITFDSYANQLRNELDNAGINGLYDWQAPANTLIDPSRLQYPPVLDGLDPFGPFGLPDSPASPASSGLLAGLSTPEHDDFEAIDALYGARFDTPTPPPSQHGSSRPCLEVSRDTPWCRGCRQRSVRAWGVQCMDCVQRSIAVIKP